MTLFFTAQLNATWTFRIAPLRVQSLFHSGCSSSHCSMWSGVLSLIERYPVNPVRRIQGTLMHKAKEGFPPLSYRWGAVYCHFYRHTGFRDDALSVNLRPTRPFGWMG